MIFFKHSLITFTILVIAIWVMPATSDDDIEILKGMDKCIDIE